MFFLVNGWVGRGGGPRRHALDLGKEGAEVFGVAGCVGYGGGIVFWALGAALGARFGFDFDSLAFEGELVAFQCEGVDAHDHAEDALDLLDGCFGVQGEFEEAFFQADGHGVHVGDLGGKGGDVLDLVAVGFLFDELFELDVVEVLVPDGGVVDVEA